MKIGLTCAAFNKQGGISRYVVELAERFVKKHEVHILTSLYENKINGLKVHEDWIPWKPISLQVSANALRNYHRIKRLKADGIDIINSQGADAVNSDVVTMQSCQKAAVTQFSGDRGFGYSLLKALEPRNNIVLAIEKHSLKNCKKVVAISNSVKKEVVRYYGIRQDKVEVIHSGVNLDEFNPKNKERYRSIIRGKHHLSVDDIVLIFSGWEFKRKGLRQVIEALTLLDKDVKALVVGGAEKAEYEALALKLGVKDRVVFAGHQRNISEYYAASDAFIFPTAYEPFGLVITEAMASGLPVITTKTAGAAEIITDTVDGMLLQDPYDSREAAEKVEYILKNNLLNKMGLVARKTAEKYSWDTVAEKTLKVYEETSGR